MELVSTLALMELLATSDIVLTVNSAQLPVDAGYAQILDFAINAYQTIVAHQTVSMSM